MSEATEYLRRELPRAVRAQAIAVALREEGVTSAALSVADLTRRGHPPGLLHDVRRAMARREERLP
jgi:hypothetical protein